MEEGSSPARNAASSPRFGPVTDLPGIGPARARTLAKLGLEDVRDLLFLMPVRLAEGLERIPIALAAAQPGVTVRVSGVVQKTSLQRYRRRSTLRVAVSDESGSIVALFFNQPWLFKRFLVGDTVELAGKVVDASGPALASPRIGSVAKPLAGAGDVTPLYPLVDGMAQDFLAGLCRFVAQRFAEQVEEPLGAQALERLELPALPRALRDLHLPDSRESFGAARRRVALESLLVLQARLHERRRTAAKGRALAARVDDAEELRLRGAFPFVFTAAQARVADELRADLARSAPMRRLLQGDVGSGKTALGVYGALLTARAGGQTAFLAPTELLAEQHFTGLRDLCARCGLHAVLSTGSLPSGERKTVLAQLASGMADIAFGTHALFSADVVYRRLALCVIDEQHRFGVAQRGELLEKGRDVHALLMTATPIPRTLALALYGDLDTSVLEAKPPGRGAVTTRWVRGVDKRKVESLLLARVETGERLYWVVPRIGESEEGEPQASISAEARFERLLGSKLAQFGVELVHGRIPREERTRRLERFRRGEARTLVATTVIEVGVDVPEATLMVIEGAERLGLAQLHQLRGRIGRGPQASHCLLYGDAKAEERFRLLERTTDGFEIAEEDLRTRGMGDLTGLRQAGVNAEGLADLAADLDLFHAAQELVTGDERVFAHYRRPALARGRTHAP